MRSNTDIISRKEIDLLSSNVTSVNGFFNVRNVERHFQPVLMISYESRIGCSERCRIGDSRLVQIAHLSCQLRSSTTVCSEFT